MSVQKQASLPDEQWDQLLQLIDQGRCTPFIGPEAYSEWLPTSIITARKWTGKYDFPLAVILDDFYDLAKEKYGYPLEDSHILARVAQFLAIEKEDDMYPKNLLSNELGRMKPPQFNLEQHRNSTYAVLADLNLPLYLTTNYDHFMEAALESRGRKPVSEFCCWNEKLYNYTKAASISSVFDKGKKYKPTVDQPLVYHLHGVVDIAQSMVLTEKDYLDFAINLNKNDEKLSLPAVVRTTLATSSFMFIGYRLEDITFRVIFQGVMSLLGNIQRPKSMAVQLPPTIPEEKREKVNGYLNAYIKNMFSLYAYWGSLKSFSIELRDRLDKYRSERTEG
jgi:hypothetical protein